MRGSPARGRRRRALLMQQGRLLVDFQSPTGGIRTAALNLEPMAIRIMAHFILTARTGSRQLRRSRPRAGEGRRPRAAARARPGGLERWPVSTSPRLEVGFPGYLWSKDHHAFAGVLFPSSSPRISKSFNLLKSLSKVAIHFIM